ncbi:UNVERIFIED_CONTAM: hypothetical protein K2H54_060758 [Gekko kuhli]
MEGGGDQLPMAVAAVCTTAAKAMLQGQQAAVYAEGAGFRNRGQRDAGGCASLAAACRRNSRRRECRRRSRIFQLLRLAAESPARRWWVYPRAEEWWATFITQVWSDEKWFEHFRMSRAPGTADAPPQTHAVTHAIAEELLRRVVYLRNPDRVRSPGGVCVIPLPTAC